MIITPTVTPDQIADIGMTLVAQCFKFDVKDELESTDIRISINFLGIIYSVIVPKLEANDEKNIQDAYKQLIEMIGVCHMMGQKANIRDGSRKLTDEEAKILGL